MAFYLQFEAAWAEEDACWLAFLRFSLRWGKLFNNYDDPGS